MNNEPPLQIDDLHGWYGESHVLHGLSLSVGEGETVALLGRNGAGKTTLLRAIVGLLPTRKGRIRIWGTDALGTEAHKIARLGVRLCTRGTRHIHVADSLRESHSATGAVGTWHEHQGAVRTLSKPGRASRQFGGQLSGGEQQMLAIARILHAGARLMLLDEPTEGLAPVIVHKIGKVIELLKKKGISILIAEQNLHFASRIADRFYLVEGGKVTATANREEFAASRKSIEFSLGV